LVNNINLEVVKMKQVTQMPANKQFIHIFFHAAFSVFLFASSANSVFAKTYQSLQSIKSTVKNYLEEHNNSSFKHKISIGKIDKRLRLVTCNTELEAFLLPGSKHNGSTTVGVRCSSPKEWTLYVPAKVKTYKQVAISSRPLSRGEEIDSNSVRFVEKEISTLNSGYFTQANNVIGKIARRALPTDHILTPKSIKSANLVLRGEEVAIIVKSNGFQIRVAGEALMDGSAKQKIKVKNKASKKVLEAIVTGRGIVSVRM